MAGGSSIGEGRWSVIRAAGARARTVALVAGALLVCCACGGTPSVDDVRLSLLAVGDTGAPPGDFKGYEILRAVGTAMTLEDRERPVQALLLLGDNFYDRGLLADEFEQRVRSNLVLPFCHFLEIDEERAGAAAGACLTPAERRNPVPIYALLGNHDWASPGSAELQREAVPRIVTNWRMAPGSVAVHELGQGVSLIAFDSDPAFRGRSAAELSAALRRSAGPWRIVAAHHPVAGGLGGSSEAAADYRRRVLAAIAEAGVPVQLFLAAHEHNLQLLVQDPPAPGLHVVAGGGSSGRSIHDRDPARRAGFESPGFARLDLVGTGEAERLVASLLRVRAFPVSVEPGVRVAARASVDRAGRVTGP